MEDLREYASKCLVRLAINAVVNLNTKSEATGYGTPEDTGWAKSNWLAGAGTAPTSPVGSKEAVTFAARDQALSTLTNYRIGLSPGIYVVNNVPYIGLLNYGSSKQVSSGFIERAFLKAIEVDVPTDMRNFRGKSG
jgi:hypothetical protein